MDENEYINQYQAAVEIGLSPELLKHFTKYCPKYKEDRRLPCRIEQGFYYYRLADLKEYDRYLREKWSIPPGKDRAPIPEKLRQELFQETGYSCGLCSHTDDLEMAHVKSWASSNNNHPHNLIALCPSHHTRYDKGTRTALDQKSIESVKARFLESMRFNWHCQAAPHVHSLRLANFLKEQADAIEAILPEFRVALDAVTKSLVEDFQPPDPTLARKDDVKKALLANNKNIENLQKSKSFKTMTIRDLSEQIAPKDDDDRITKLLDSLPNEECPHCYGNGSIGWNNIICKYCKGDGLISKDAVADYDLNDIDEEECPRCDGRGTTGLRSNPCSYCKGDTVVSKQQREDYDPDDIDEVECLHCLGRGMIGQNGTLCTYCRGDQFISSNEAKNYDSNDINEVPCPRCGGRGFKQSGDACNLCNGESVVSREIDSAYRSRYGNQFD